MPGARSMRGTSSWTRSTAACWKDTTIRSRRFVFLRSPASSSAFRTYSAVSSSGVRPLISTLMGVCGNARITSDRVGTRKSDAR